MLMFQGYSLVEDSQVTHDKTRYHKDDSCPVLKGEHGEEVSDVYCVL